MLVRLLAVCALLIFTACTGAGGETTPTSSSASAGATSAPAPSTGPSATSIDGDVIGGENNPSFTVQAPSGWSSDGHFVTNMGTGVLGLSVWDVGTVPRNPCHWRGNPSDPGPTVDDLVAALTAQQERNATKPTDVTLGGYDGRYLEWSVPDDWKVTGDAEFDGCDVEPSSGLRDFVSWFGDGEGERYQQVAGQVDRLWVLNVDGHRLLVDLTYAPDTTEADRAELANIVESIRFKVVHGWPGARGAPAGVYSWDPRIPAWMHNVSGGASGIEIEFIPEGAHVSNLWPAAEIPNGDPTAATIAGYDAAYWNLGAGREEWAVDIDGTKFSILLLAHPGTTVDELAAAHAVIESIAKERQEQEPGFMLTFTLPHGWDSG